MASTTSVSGRGDDEALMSDELERDEIVKTLPNRKVRRMSVTRVAHANELKRESLGFTDLSGIRDILTDEQFSNSLLIPDRRNSADKRRRENQEATLKRLSTLKSRAESRRGRIESISMMMDNSPLHTPNRPHRRSMRGSFQKVSRSDEAANNLYELMKETEFFSQLPRKAGVEVCRHIGYRSVPEGGVLFRAGEIGLSVYFILAGSAKVYLPRDPAEPSSVSPTAKDKKSKLKKKDETAEDKDSATEGNEDILVRSGSQIDADVDGAAAATSTAGAAGADGVSIEEELQLQQSKQEKKQQKQLDDSNSKEDDEDIEDLLAKKEEGKDSGDDSDDNESDEESTENEESFEEDDQSKATDSGSEKPDQEEDYGRFVVELFSPSMFGELALLRESPRTGTVVCEENTELMVLERHDFDRILRRMGNVVFMPERLKEILSVPPKLRAAEENYMALDLLGKHKFLQNLDKEIAAQLMGKLTLSVVQKNELIFRQGEVGSQFYIILTGKVHIFVDRRDRKEPDEKKQEEAGEEKGEGDKGKKEGKDKKKETGSPDSKSPEGGKTKGQAAEQVKEGEGEGEDKKENFHAGMKQGFEQSTIISETIYSGRGDRMVEPEMWEEVLGMKKQTLGAGDSFGDRALLQKNTLRTASVIAAEKTEIMVLSQADFKKLFAKDSNEVEGFERVAELLQIDSGARSKDQLDELAQLLTKTSSFFQTLEPELHYDICQAASYKRLQPNEVVFVQGEVGDAFYVVLRGTLSLHIKGTPGLPPPKIEPKEPTGEDDDEGFEEPEDLTDIYGPCISVLSGGQSFGELALLHGMPRTGTVLCQDESELLVLWKADYDEILQTSQARELERQVAFLRNLPNLDKLSTGRLMRIAYCFQLKELSRGYTLLQQGKTSEKGHVYVYIVKEGAIKMVRKTNMKKLAGAFHASVAPSARLSILSNNLGLSPRKQGGKTMTPTKGGINTKEDTLGLPQETEICVLGPGEICGDIAAFLDVPQPVSITAVCDTVLHVVKLEDLVRSVSDESILEEFRHTSRNRLKWILERESRITSTWTSYLMQAQELRMTKGSPRPQKKKKKTEVSTPKRAGDKKNGSSIVASPGMTKTSVVFQSRSLVERAEEAIKSLVQGTKQLDSKMWDTMKNMDVSMTKHYWSPSKQKPEKSGPKLSLPDINTPNSKSNSLVQILSSKSSLYLSPGQTLSPVKIPPIGTPSRFRYKRSPFNSRITPKSTGKSTPQKL